MPFRTPDTRAALLPLQAVPAQHADDIEAAERVLRVGFPFSSMRPIPDRPFWSTTRFASICGIGMYAALTSGYGTWTPESPETAFGLISHLGGPGVSRIRLGRSDWTVDRQHAMLFRARALATDYADGLVRLTLRIPEATIMARLAALVDGVTTAPLTLDQRIDFSREPGGSLSRLLRMLLDEIDRDPGLLEAPLVLASWQDLLLTTLLVRFPHSASSLFTTPTDLAPWQVRRAEAWLEAHATEPITMEDLAHGIGVSLRTIQHTFQRSRGYTPREFLRRCRLELARRRLLEADPNDTVTGVALECGFGHFGDFARDYKRRFGESPSTTLRRR
jgi:AraC-like DNA-binding protein